jgi:hypothetical protein
MGRSARQASGSKLEFGNRLRTFLKTGERGDLCHNGQLQDLPDSH